MSGSPWLRPSVSFPAVLMPHSSLIGGKIQSSGGLLPGAACPFICLHHEVIRGYEAVCAVWCLEM